MNKRSINIATQLEIGFTIVLALVILLGVVSYNQTQKLHQQTATLFNHPFQVTQAIADIRTEVQKMELAYKNLTVANSLESRSLALHEFELSSSASIRRFNVIFESYLGPKKDVDVAFEAFSMWKSVRNEQMKNFTKGASQHNLADLTKVDLLKDSLSSKLLIINSFALNKANQSFTNSQELSEKLAEQLLMIVIFIVVLSFIVNYILLRNIRIPLRILGEMTQRFRHGDLKARSSYDHNNEFGLLSDSFNKLADQFQQDIELGEKMGSISTIMLSESDTRTFFRVTLTSLMKQTNSQMAALYLVSDDQQKLDLYESIGLSEPFRKSFNMEHFEGEMGPVIATRKILHIKSVQENSPFTFQTACGTILPREIFTLPLVAENKVFATIHLASINAYDEQSGLFLDTILDTLSARVVGILATQKIKSFSEKLEVQNRELEMQKTELSKQSETLLNQNTELEVQKYQLDEANKLKTTFLSNMSHELRTPLNSVIALSGVLNRRLANKIPIEEYSYLDVIERNGKHLLSLINDILDISRIEAGKEEVEIMNFDAGLLLNEIKELIEPQALEKHIEIRYVAVSNDLSVTSDQKKFRHIVQNIIGNAVKFTEKGAVEIRAEKNERYLKVAISDSGIGISENQIKHIFDEFRQADNSTSRRFGGTGLGLSIAKKYAELLGGSISVKSTLGEGSVFTLLLPIAISESRMEPIEIKSSISERPLKDHSDTNRKTILLVEDSEPALIQLSDVLQEGGYRMLMARNGHEALESISQTIPDAMILDLMMPDMDGFEVLKTLREEESTAHVPVLILTAKHISKEELRFLKRNNVHQLVQKGDINRNELLRAVEDMAFKSKNVIGQPTMDHSKPSILVVEDNPDNMLTARALLSDQYQVLEAIDGNEALLMARIHLPRLILMDIELPGIDGVEAFKKIRGDAHTQNIPIVALTASAMTTERETILAYGFDGYIAKPIDQVVFAETIKKIIYG